MNKNKHQLITKNIKIKGPKKKKNRTGKDKEIKMINFDNLASVAVRVTQRFTVADSLLKVKNIF